MRPINHRAPFLKALFEHPSCVLRRGAEWGHVLIFYIAVLFFRKLRSKLTSFHFSNEGRLTLADESLKVEHITCPCEIGIRVQRRCKLFLTLSTHGKTPLLLQGTYSFTWINVSLEWVFGHCTINLKGGYKYRMERWEMEVNDGMSWRALAKHVSDSQSGAITHRCGRAAHPRGSFLFPHLIRGCSQTNMLWNQPRAKASNTDHLG